MRANWKRWCGWPLVGAAVLVALWFLHGCAPAAEGEAPDDAPAPEHVIASPVRSGDDSRDPPVCFPKGSMERLSPNRIALVERTDGALPCVGFLVGTWQYPPQPDAYLMTWGRCRPRPGVASVAWFGARQTECTTKAITPGQPFMVTSVEGDFGSDDLPALVRLEPDAWTYSGLDVAPAAATPPPPGAPLLLPQYAVGGLDRQALVTSHAQGPECRAGLALGGVFQHTCDTSLATSGPEIAQGAPVFALRPDGGYSVVGMHAGPVGGVNTALPVAAFAALLALAP